MKLICTLCLLLLAAGCAAPKPATPRRATAIEISNAANSGQVPAWFSPPERAAVEYLKEK